MIRRRTSIVSRANAIRSAAIMIGLDVEMRAHGVWTDQMGQCAYVRGRLVTSLNDDSCTLDGIRGLMCPDAHQKAKGYIDISLHDPAAGLTPEGRLWVGVDSDGDMSVYNGTPTWDEDCWACDEYGDWWSADAQTRERFMSLRPGELAPASLVWDASRRTPDKETTTSEDNQRETWVDEALQALRAQAGEEHPMATRDYAKSLCDTFFGEMPPKDAVIKDMPCWE